MEVRHLTCIGCPMGCSLTVEMGPELKVTGNTCPKGAEYAKKEVTDPRRIVTSTVRVLGGTAPVVSCKTSGDIPKGQIFAVMAALSRCTVSAPVSLGEVLLPNVCGLGTDILATKAVAKETEI